MRKYDFDLVVIGSGAAGIAAAKMARNAKLRVAIVEKAKLGGSELNTRDVPYAAGMHFSHLYVQAVYGSRFGISSENLRFNYATATHWREKVTNRMGADLKKELEEAKIQYFRGKARFVNAHEVAIGSSGKLSADKILIATGSRQRESGIFGLEEVPYLMPENALTVERPPMTVMVVGGGSSGVEIAQYFAELGSKVAIAEVAERLLPREDEEVGKTVEELFDKRFDIRVLKQSRVIAVERDAISIKVIFLRDGQEKMVRVETVVIATGTEPAIAELDLEKAGVKLTRSGNIRVDKTLQTSARNIFAAGDVLGGDSSTERAEYEGGLAVKNILKRNSNYANYSGFIRVTDTDPQIATVGLTEDDLNRRARKYNSVVVPLSNVVASRTYDLKTGFIKMLASKDGKLLGATIMAPGAAEIIQEVAVMVRHNFSVMEIASTPHVAMSWSDLVRLAARELAAK